MSHLSALSVPTNASVPALARTQPVPDHVCDSAADSGAERSRFDRQLKVAFLAALAATGSVRAASASVGVSHQTAYRARLSSPGFRRAWDAALLAARAQAEEVLACRALEGWEEDVVYHGEVVARRRRWSDRLLLAHLARLDRLCGDAEVAEFADAFDDNLTRYAAGEDRPARVVEVEREAEAKGSPSTGSGQAGEGEGISSPGVRSTWSRRVVKSAEERAAEDKRVAPKGKAGRCPDCGGRCLGPAWKLDANDCQWEGHVWERMDAERPIDEPMIHELPGDYDYGDTLDEQTAAYLAGVPEWWRVVPPPVGGDLERWHFYDEDEEEGAG